MPFSSSMTSSYFSLMLPLCVHYLLCVCPLFSQSDHRHFIWPPSDNRAAASVALAVPCRRHFVATVTIRRRRLRHRHSRCLCPAVFVFVSAVARLPPFDCRWFHRFSVSMSHRLAVAMAVHFGCRLRCSLTLSGRRPAVCPSLFWRRSATAISLRSFSGLSSVSVGVLAMESS